MFTHPTVSSSMLSTAASIGFFSVGSAYTLYQLCFGGSDGTERNRKTSQTTCPPPPPIYTDTLHRILAHLPLGERLQTSRQVNSEWAQVVAGQFRRQKILALLIGGGGTGQRKEQLADLSHRYQFKPQCIPPQHVHPFQSMAVEVLTGEAAAVLASAFPHLQTLTVLFLMDKPQDNSAETIQTTFSNFSTLISALASTLTTLQLVFIVEKTAFQAHFPSLFESLTGLTRLKHLTLMDFNLKLTLPASFNLEKLLPNSLETLKLHFWSHSTSVPKLHQSLQRYLNAREKNSPKLQIDLVLGSYAQRSASLAPLAAHLHALYLIAYSAEDLRLFCSRFTALRQLVCWTVRLPSLAGTVAQLAARLPHLTQLFLYVVDAEMNPNGNVAAANAAAANGDDHHNDADEDNAQLQAAIEANIEANAEAFAAEAAEVAAAAAAQQNPALPPPPPPSSLPSLKHLLLSVERSTVDHAYLGQLLHPTVLPAVQRVVLFLYPSPTVSCADCGWTLRKLPDPQNVEQDTADQLRQFEAALRRCLAKVAAPFATTAAAAAATKPSCFSAYIIVSRSRYIVCRIHAEDWPEVKVLNGAGAAAADDDIGQEVQVPERCFQLVIKT
ncbi:hypothetical protein TYRP_019513 [Tyrophagus putrescentiae]|nr:hypothetical protein TYRP_019513 [Tyrophagus putrescentiae]